MKFNKWTLGLAAVGAVSMASAVQADESKMSAVNTALSNTTLSGYVDVGLNYTAGHQFEGKRQEDRNAYSYYGLYYQDNRNQFSLNTVNITLDKPLDDSAWAAGYHIDINAGSSAINALALYDDSDEDSGYTTLNPGTLAIRQAYVTLRTPIANGIDWKIGAMDGITGYEVNTGYANPNYTRSYGYAINPASFIGVLGTYKFADFVSATVGVVNRGTSMWYYDQWNGEHGDFDYVGSVSFTAPESFGFLKGSSLNLQTIQGLGNWAVNNYSVSATLATPVAGLKLGFVWDAIQSTGGSSMSYDGNIYGIYATYQATDKLLFALRGEYVDATDLFSFYGPQEEVTATVEYNLWANVVTRGEFRWDHTEHEWAGYANDFQLNFNVVYKF